MTANTRIQWFHKKILDHAYPNAARLAERFQISHRQAQRDVDYLRTALRAPLVYNAMARGYYYSEEYSLPLVALTANDDAYLEELDGKEPEGYGASEAIVQMQIPYTATIEMPEKLAAIELSRYIISMEGKGRYLCEFRNVEAFIGVLFASEANIKLIEPEWLRERLIKDAFRMLDNNT